MRIANKKIALIIVLLIISLSIIGFSQNTPTNNEISIYYDAGMVKEIMRLEKESEIELPYGIIEDSFYVKGNSKIEEFSIKRVGELENNIGDYIIAFYKDKRIEGKLLDYRNGKAYIKNEEGINVISPDGFILKDVKSTTKALLKFEDNPGESIINYLTNKINWKASHKILLGEKTLMLESFALINNRDNKDYEGNVKLYTKNIYNYAPIYIERKTLAMDEGANVIKEEKQTTMEFSLGERKIPAKSKLSVLLDSGKANYERISTYKTYYSTSTKSKLTDSITFTSPYVLPKGDVYVYSDFFEGFVSIETKAKGEEVKLELGKDSFVEGKTEVIDSKYQKDKKGKILMEEKEVEITINNYGKKEKQVEVIVNMPFNYEWEVLSSNEHYDKKEDKIIYRLDLKGLSDKEINFRVRVYYDKQR